MMRLWINPLNKYPASNDMKSPHIRLRAWRDYLQKSNVWVWSSPLVSFPSVYSALLSNLYDVFEQHFGVRDISRSEALSSIMPDTHSQRLADNGAGKPWVLIAKGYRRSSVERVRMGGGIHIA